MTNKVESLWQRIIERGSRYKASFKEHLNLQPGASDEELQRLEETVGMTLPEEIKSFYQVDNGRVWESECCAFVRNVTLSPVSEIIDNWNFLQEELDLEDDLELESI